MYLSTGEIHMQNRIIRGEDMMPCRITDIDVIDDGIIEETEKKDALSLTLDELMAEDWYPYITKHNNLNEFVFGIEGDDGELEETRLNPCAAEGLAEFCERYLNFYNKAKGE